MGWSGFSWILLTHWLIRFLTNELHCSLHYMYLLCDTESNDVMSYWRPGQHELNRGPHNLLMTRLRATLMYAYIKGVGGMYSPECHYLQTISCVKTVVEWQGSRPY
jgi:hypothetical protein